MDEVKPTDTDAPTSPGDGHDVFMRLYMAHQERVRAFIIAQVGRIDHADEILQDTAVALWELWDRYDRDTRFGTWACGVARNKVFEFWRKRRRDPVLDPEAVEALAAIQEDDNGETTDAAERRTLDD